MTARNKTSTEKLAVSILTDTKEPMLISEIVEIIKKQSPTHLTGKTPEKSFYSMIYRNEKRRVENNQSPIFKMEKRGSMLFLELNNK